MKLARFKFECLPHSFGYPGDGIKMLRFHITDHEGNVREFKQMISLDTLPDDKSLFDYIFDYARKSFEDECKGVKP